MYYDHKQVKNYISKKLQQSNASETDKIRQNLQCKLQELLQRRNVASTMLQAVQLSDTPTLCLTRERSFAPNKNHEIQQRYFSTKKKRKTASGLTKPTQELTQQSKKLVDQEPFCGVCFKIEDNGNFGKHHLDTVRYVWYMGTPGLCYCIKRHEP